MNIKQVRSFYKNFYDKNDKDYDINHVVDTVTVALDLNKIDNEYLENN